MIQGDSVAVAAAEASDSVAADTVASGTVTAGMHPAYMHPNPGAPLPVDSLGGDTVAVAGKAYGILLEAPEAPDVEANPEPSYGMSYIIGGLAILFFIIGLRFRNNHKYVGAMLRNMVEVRVRNNAFDETVREATFLVLLNFLWSCSAGIIIWSVLGFTLPASPGESMHLRELTTYPAATIGICMGVGVLYSCLMALAYVTVGTVFSDGGHARLWVKGFAAGQGLLGLVYLPLSLLLLFYPQWTEILLWIALGMFIMAKIVFIWKGFRIFFTQISSWVLFLYYLCSLEIVPLILTYLAAWWLCSLL